MATRRQKAKKRATSPTRDKLVRKRKPSKPKSGNLKPVITGLKTELREALEQQTATAQVLQVINASHGNLEPIFDIILEKAIDLCGAKFGVLFLHDGKIFTVEAARNVPPAYEETVRGQAFAPGTNPVLHHLQEHKAPFQVKDVFDEAYVARDPLRVAAIELAGVRSLVAVPLLKGAELIGFVGIYRDKPGGFADSQIALVSAFADQAVIAIENARLLSEQHEALERQTATAEVLQVINSSPGDLAPVFDAVLKSATRLCDAAFGILWLCDGEHFHAAALYGASEGYAEIARAPHRPLPSNPLGRLLRGERLIVSLDVAAEEPYRSGDPVRRALVDVGGARSVVQVALVKDDVLLGSLTVYRQEVRSFSDKQIALLQNFAAQAVIAIENTRLLTEQREALERQTATADILRVISGSPADVQPTFEAIAISAARLCDAEFSAVARFEDGLLHLAATNNLSADEAAAFHSLFPRPALRNFAIGRAFVDGCAVQFDDVLAQPDYDQRTRDVLQSALGYRTFMAVPILRSGKPIGVVGCARRRVKPFSAEQIQMLNTFAEQASIALDNVRLFTDLRQRTDDLTESLEYQIATSEVLNVISRSTTDLQPVLDAMCGAAIRLCSGQTGGIAVKRGDKLHFLAAVGHTPQFERHLRNNPFSIDRSTSTARAVIDKDVVHIVDIEADPEYAHSEASTLGQLHTILSVPLMREGEAVGVITVSRSRRQAFTERQIALIKTFADQAVIAMENTRLLGELRKSLEQQTATAEVLQVINSSPGNLEPVFITVLEKALRLCEAAFGVFWTYDGNHFHASALLGVPAAFADFAKQRPHRVGNDNTHARALRGEAVMHIVDAAESEAYRLGDPLRRALVDLGGARTSLGVALRKDDALLGVLILYRKEVRPFSERQISLIESFAGQAVVAMENARLLDQLHQRTDDLARSVDELSATGDVLKTISRSSTDLKAVLDTLLETVARLCRADQTYMFRRHEELHHLVAAYGVPPEGEEYIRTHPFKPGRGTTSGRVALERRTVHIEDVLSDPEYTYTEGQSTAGFRTMLGLPLLREDTLVGVFVLGRTRVEPFSPKEIELASSFADQAVIAIENARLFEELRDRQAELRVTFDNMGDGVAMFDADHRLGAWNRNFEQIIGLSEALAGGTASLCRVSCDCWPSAASLARRTSRPSLPAASKTPTAS